MSSIAPQVYWVSSPVYANETLLIAGAGLNSTTAGLFRDSRCTRPVPARTQPDTWEKASKLLMPATGCGPPCWACLTSSEGAILHALAVNQPDVWWAAGASPASPMLAASAPNLTISSAVEVTVLAGETLRVFGRSLAWNATHCITAAVAPSPVASTQLLLTSLDGSDNPPPLYMLPASGATCYEAAFETTLALAGRFSASLATPWAASASFMLTILSPPPPSPPPVVIDVLADHGGDLLAALTAASKLPHDIYATLSLGAHAYELVQPLVLRSRTTLCGAGANATSLHFALPPTAGSAVSVGDNTSLLDLSLSLSTNRSNVIVLEVHGCSGLRAARLHISQRLNATVGLGAVLDVQGGRGFELTDSTVLQRGGCAGASALSLHRAQRGLIARNNISWNCSAFGFDVSDEVVMEQNAFTSLQTGPLHGGNYIATYDLYHHASNQRWSIARNSMSRTERAERTESNWNEKETLTTDAPHSYNMGYVAEIGGPDNTSVRLWPSAGRHRMFPPVGATLLVLGGPGAGQTRLVTGRNATGLNTYTIERAFDGYMVPNVSKIAALPTVGKKLIVGNTFLRTAVVQYYANNVLDVTADNSFLQCAARGDSGFNGPIQAQGLCYKGAPGQVLLSSRANCYESAATATTTANPRSRQVLFTEILGNTVVDSDGIVVSDNFDYKGCFHPGPWIRAAVVRRNSISGISDVARFQANATNATAPRCGAVWQAAWRGGPNSSDVVAEHQEFACPAGMLDGGGNNLSACDHCLVR